MIIFTLTLSIKINKFTTFRTRNLADVKEITLEKSKSGNPMLGFDKNGEILYGGDPSILVDGDTVYAYVGHDTSTEENYIMPDWQCYSSKNMKEWTYEGEILSNSEISWAKDKVSSWASQVIKYQEKNYLNYYTESKKQYGGGKFIGLAVSDSTCKTISKKYWHL